MPSKRVAYVRQHTLRERPRLAVDGNRVGVRFRILPLAPDVDDEDTIGGSSALRVDNERATELLPLRELVTRPCPELHDPRRRHVEIGSRGAGFEANRA